MAASAPAISLFKVIKFLLEYSLDVFGDGDFRDLA